jgi:hypothetical protein
MKVSSISLRLRADLWRILQDVVQERKEQFYANAEAALQVIVFALVAQGKSGDGVAVHDFEKRSRAGVAEGDQQFAKERLLGSGFPATEGELPKECHAPFNGFKRIFCSPSGLVHAGTHTVAQYPLRLRE